MKDSTQSKLFAKKVLKLKIKNLKLASLSIVLAFFLFPKIAFAETTIPVPFTPQAPHANWAQPWQDACEETVIVMVDYYYSNFTNRNVPKDLAADSILKIYNLKTNTYGYSLDENANLIVELINNYYPWEAKIVKNPSLVEIKKEIDAGRPVILPVHGKYLFNRYFKDSGPDYHTIVISGYDDNNKEFITQEPGTKRGLDFRYSYDRLLYAMHDYLPGKKTKYGSKVAIFTSPIVDLSSNTDADRDGLAKAAEIKYETSLTDPDTDKDGYLDGEEVRFGYSPTLAEQNLPEGVLVKEADKPEVYLLENGQKKHIKNEIAFLSRGFRWGDILTVSNKFISGLVNGLGLK